MSDKHEVFISHTISKLQSKMLLFGLLQLLRFQSSVQLKIKMLFYGFMVKINLYSKTCFLKYWIVKGVIAKSNSQSKMLIKSYCDSHILMLSPLYIRIVDS